MKLKIWAAGINLNGLWHYEPILMEYNEELESWWNDEGELCVLKEGLDFSNELCITFASANKNDVVCFINGAKSLSVLMHNLTRFTFPELNEPQQG